MRSGRRICRIKIMYALLRCLPRNLLSHVTGRLASCPLPQPVRNSLIHWFCRRYRVKTEEAARPVAEYRSLKAFFIRDLKPGVRPLGEGLVSPVDGRLSQAGVIEQGTLVQVKGKEYDVQSLLADPVLAERFANGFYLTFYLAPGDYHHIHAPAAGVITGASLVPGDLWPVNDWSVSHIDRLFCRNERVISVLDTEDYGTIAVVKVGATNVGSVRLAYAPLTGNQAPWLFRSGKAVVRQEFEPPIRVEKGERIGTFELGSTVLLLLEPGRFSGSCPEGPVRMGMSLCR